MYLSIESINFKNFRNYSNLELNKLGALTIFVGLNAIGKTNIIEGIQLVTSLSSFRNAHINQLITWGSEESFIEVREVSSTRQLDVCLNIKEGKRIYSINGKTKKPKELRGILPSVVFNPDDLSLIKGSQSIKRTSLDSIGVQLNSNYQIIKRDYEKVVQHKNSLLKEERISPVLQSINETLLIIGSQFYNYRNTLFQKMIPFIQEYYHNITGKKEILQCSYIPSWEISDPEILKDYSFSKDEAFQNLSSCLEKKGREEQIRRYALLGPHADKIEFFINGKNAGIYGSQGQQRSLVLAYKLAEVAIIQEIAHQKPVLLLDDVMSELDSERRELLLNFISGDIQTFITTTNLDYFSEDILQQAQIISLPFI